jgi:hypothetical protein
MNLTGHADCSAEEKELFRQRGLSGVRMRDDRERTPWLVLDRLA